MKKVGKIILMIICGIAFVTLVIFVFMSLWNWLVPELFNGPVINFCKAAGLLLLAKIIFGLGKGHGHCRKCGGGPGSMWKNKMREKWHAKMSHLSPEEKEEMKNKWQQCWWGDDQNKSTETPNQ
jgi:hypothetical protein